MDKVREITAEQLAEFLRSLGIKEEGIQAINDTFLTDNQRWQMMKNVQNFMRERPPRNAVRAAWCGTQRVQKVRMRKVGDYPTEEDLSKL